MKSRNNGIYSIIKACTVSAVTHWYQLRKERYEPSEKRLDVRSTGRHILNLYLESLLDRSLQPSFLMNTTSYLVLLQSLTRPERCFVARMVHCKSPPHCLWRSVHLSHGSWTVF